MRPFPVVAFLVVAAAVFKLLLFVPELRELAFVFCFLSFQLWDGFLFCHSA